MLVLNNSYELGTTYLQVFLLWMFCSELVSFACVYFVITVEMARAANSPVFGPSVTVLKQSASNFFSDDVTPGRYSLLAKNFCFLQSFIIQQRIFFTAVLSILPFCQRSVSLVSTQISEPCQESIKATNIFVYSLSPRFRFRTSIPKLSTAMYPFRISVYEHVPLKFLMTKSLRKVKKYIYCTSKHLLILKIILTDVDLCINASISK